MTTAPPASRAFLAHFPDEQKSLVTNLFLYAVRHGAGTPTAVYADVFADMRRRLARPVVRPSAYGDIHPEDARDEAVYQALMRHYDEALDFAGWALQWEALPQAERDRLKREKGETHRRAYLAGQPATDKQIAYLRALGYQGDVTSKAHASDLIEQYKGGGAL